MILLDTHIWVWWVAENERLTEHLLNTISIHQNAGPGISVISCWEVAKLVERRRLELTWPVAEWIEVALAYPGVRLLALTPQIAVASTQLPGDFHRDPADQIIVATARTYDLPLLTVDSQILNYPNVRTLE